MLNIYKYHTHPATLSLYDKMDEINPDFFWDKYRNNPEELRKGEGVISKSAKYSYLYAREILKGRFEAGEEVIATDAWSSYWYARDVLRERFELGEKILLRSRWKQSYLNFLEDKAIKI